MTKQLRKAIMKRSELENKFYKKPSVENKKFFKKQKNYCNRLYKRERLKFYKKLEINNLTDNKKFWRTMNPFFSNKGNREDVVHIDGEKIISDDTEVAETFNEFFKNCVDSLNIFENKFLISGSENESGCVNKSIKKFENHPSIRSINENVKISGRFSFSIVNTVDLKQEINNLNNRKIGTFMNISVKQLKQTIDIVCEPLKNIFNEEIINNKRFPSKLKLADITPIFKALETVTVKNYRPVSILPTVSKIFERLMQKQMNDFVESHLSPYLCGYRKGYNSQYALLAMIMKHSRDNYGFAGCVQMDLSKAFDTINHQLLIAKLYAYGFSKDACEIIYSYLTNRWHGTKINISFSTWAK